MKPTLEDMERRSSDDSWRERIEEEIDSLRVELKTNTIVTASIKEDVSEVYDILLAAKGAFKVLAAIGVAAKWLGMLAAAVTAIYIFWYQITHSGSLPK